RGLWLQLQPQGGSPTMAEFHGTPRALTLVAIDIAKDCHDVLIELTAPARRQRFRVANTAEDFQRLTDSLRGTTPQVLIGFKATGNYHRPLAYFLLRQG